MQFETRCVTDHGGIDVDLDTDALSMNPVAAAMPGETGSSQAWFRDGFRSNFSDSIAITVQ